MGGSGQRMGGSGQRVKQWAKSAFCGQRCNFVGQRNFIHAFAPMVANSLGQCGPDCLEFLWLTAEHAAQTQFGFGLDDVNNNCLNEQVIDSQQAIDFWKVSG